MPQLRTRRLQARFPLHAEAVQQVVSAVHDAHGVSISFEGRNVFLVTAEAKIEITDKFLKEFSIQASRVDREDFLSRKCFPLKNKVRIWDRMFAIPWAGRPT